MTSSTDGVSLHLTHSIDEDGEYHAFTNVSVDIFLNLKKVGLIEATIIDRQKIPDGSFMSAMDGHSGILQKVGCAVYEPRYGRTKLRSLADYDDMEFDTMYIETFHIDDNYKKNGSSDIGAIALRRFLHDPFISGNLQYGCWKVPSAVYILNPLEAMSEQERTEFNKKTMEASQVPSWNRPEETDEDRAAKAAEDRHLAELARMDANQFLRNGFFQDPAIARQGNENFLVASYGQWTQEPLSHDQAAAVQFYVSPPTPEAPTGRDADILKAVMTACSPYSSLEPTELATLMVEISRLLTAGGSVSRSHAIHAACANNSQPVVDALLKIDPSIVNSFDRAGQTPLMTAAESAAGRKTNQGIPETRVIDTLLAAGANEQLQDPFGLTAYGHFMKMRKQYSIMMNAMCGRPSTSISRHPSEAAIEQKLLPPGGATASDMAGGEDTESGFMDYSAEDQEHDDMMGSDY